MYNEHFGFDESPFNVTPDPRFFYSNRLYQEAFTGLRWGIKLRQGLIVISGEAGTGKTTLLRMVTEKFEPDVRAALILGPYPDFSSLLELMLIDFGLPKPPGGRLTMMRELRSYLTEQLQKNQIVSVLFDEAQEMDVRTLKELELLLDLEADDEKLLQVVLAGSLELETKLAHPDLRSIKQRIALWCRLAPLESREVAPYIDHRVMRAGQECKNLFVPDAVERIALISRGIPRLINIICDNALLAAYRAGQKSIPPEMIQKIAHDLRLTKESEPRAAVTSQRFEKAEDSFHFSERAGKNFAVLKIITAFLAAFVLVGSALLHHFKPSKRMGLKNSAIVGASGQLIRPAAEKLVPGVLEGDSFGETAKVQMRTPEDRLAAQKTTQGPLKTVRAAAETDQFGAKVYMHTSEQEDRSILQGIGNVLRVRGYTIPETRLSSSRTQGDVRFFFPQDRPAAERVKSVVESELTGLGFSITLQLLERDRRQFQFAAPGKIEVWIPPLPKSKYSPHSLFRYWNQRSANGEIIWLVRRFLTTRAEPA